MPQVAQALDHLHSVVAALLPRQADAQAGGWQPILSGGPEAGVEPVDQAASVKMIAVASVSALLTPLV